MWCSATALVLLVAVAVSGVRCKGSRFISNIDNNTSSRSNSKTNPRTTTTFGVIKSLFIYLTTPRIIESVVYASSTSSSPSSSSTSSTSSSSTSSTSSSSTSNVVSSFSRENEANAAPVSGSYPRRCPNIDGECSTSIVRLPDKELGNIKVFTGCGKSNNGDTRNVIFIDTSRSRTIGVTRSTTTSTSSTSSTSNFISNVINGTSFHLTGIVTTSIVIGSVSGLFGASVQ